MPETTIRRAEVDDAQTLSAVGRETFIQAFGHLYPDADLQAFLDHAHSLAYYQRTLRDEAKALWLAESEGRAVGYALAGPCNLPHPDVTSACGELHRIYLLAGHQGGGAGSRLFTGAMDWLDRQGRADRWIGVWSGNDGAQRFYARHGFEKVGEYIFPVGRVRDQEFILRRPAARAT